MTINGSYAFFGASLFVMHFFYALIQIFDLVNKGYATAFQISDLGNATANAYPKLRGR